MGIYKKGDDYYIDYYVNSHRKREKIGPSYKAAQHVLRKRKVEVAENRWIEKRPESNVTLKKLVDLFLEYSKANKTSYKTDVYRSKHIFDYFGDVLASKVTSFQIEKYKELRKSQVSATTVNRELELLKSIFTKPQSWVENEGRTSPWC